MQRILVGGAKQLLQRFLSAKCFFRLRFAKLLLYYVDVRTLASFNVNAYENGWC